MAKNRAVVRKAWGAAGRDLDQSRDSVADVMGLGDDLQIIKARTRVLAAMREYMREVEVSYAEAQVVACEAILTSFLERMDAAADRAAGLDLVRDAVLALNELNDHCGGELIETDQREDLCEVLLRAGALRGFHDADDDVTEEWRNW